MGTNGVEGGLPHQAHQKGDLSSFSNYRGITLLSISRKVFYRILLNRMKDAIDPQLCKQQVGFHFIGLALTKSPRCVSWWSSPWSGIHVYINLVDYGKAFDGVDRQTL